MIASRCLLQPLKAHEALDAHGDRQWPGEHQCGSTTTAMLLLQSFLQALGFDSQRGLRGDELCSAQIQYSRAKAATIQYLVSI